MPPYENLTSAQRQWLASSLLCALAVNASAANVRVFTDRHHPVEAPPEIPVIELDKPAALQAELSAHLPADPGRAASIVHARLGTGGAVLQQKFATAYQGVVDAWSLGVTKIPAVVVDQRYVVYGVQNVARAVSVIERYRREHR